jgi:LCP family protein required for cell wall assembly
MTSLDRLPLSRRQLAALGAGALSAAWWSSSNAVAGETRSWTFLVLGLDTREENADQRSDIMMISRVDEAAGTVRTLSIPRDLWVEIPGHGQHKVNAAFQIGLAESPDLNWEDAAALTADTINRNLGITIDGTALTDMNRFPAIIDAVGGVDVNNPYELVDPGNSAVNFPAGMIHLDGEQALVFTRSRHVDTDDGRVMRQHLVLEGLLRRMQDPDIYARLPELIASLRGAVRSDLGVAMQLQLISLLPDISADDLAFTNIADQCWAGWSDDGQWIYEADWTTLPQYVQDWLDGVQG